MIALTLRLPDDQHRRRKALARQRGVSINRLLDEAATLLLTEFDAETRYLHSMIIAIDTNDPRFRERIL